jgi:hypothetical protein
MNKSKLILTLACVVMMASMISCNKGGTKVDLTGYEELLPPELKGLKVYHVKTGALSYVNVAILDSRVNSASYPVGKTQQTTIILDRGSYNERTVVARGVVYENDSILIIRK